MVEFVPELGEIGNLRGSLSSAAARVLRDDDLIAIGVHQVELQVTPRLVHEFFGNYDAGTPELALKSSRILDIDLYASTSRGTVALERGKDKMRTIADDTHPAWVRLFGVRPIGVFESKAQLSAIKSLGHRGHRDAENRKGDFEHSAFLNKNRTQHFPRRLISPGATVVVLDKPLSVWIALCFREIVVCSHL
jgi:hypothetical protein